MVAPAAILTKGFVLCGALAAILSEWFGLCSLNGQERPDTAMAGQARPGTARVGQGRPGTATGGNLLGNRLPRLASLVLTANCHADRIGQRT